MTTTPPAPRRALTEDSPAASTTLPTPAGQGAPVPDASGAPTPGDGYLSHKQIMGVMGGLMAGMFLAALDQTIEVQEPGSPRRVIERAQHRRPERVPVLRADKRNA